MNEIQEIYQQLLNAWNNQNAQEMADLFSQEGELIGFDGSIERGPENINSHLAPIFRDHPTALFVSKVKDVRIISSDAALLRAIAGMVPRGQTTINPEVNAHQTLVLSRKEGIWKIELFQNTPAQFHGRPELVERMTEELQAIWNAN